MPHHPFDRSVVQVAREKVRQGVRWRFAEPEPVSVMPWAHAGSIISAMPPCWEATELLATDHASLEELCRESARVFALLDGMALECPVCGGGPRLFEKTHVDLILSRARGRGLALRHKDKCPMLQAWRKVVRAIEGEAKAEGLNRITSVKMAPE